MKNKKIIIKEEGVIAELNGKYFGSLDEDGQCLNYGFFDIEMAEIADPKYCRETTDLTYLGSPYTDDLKQSKLVKVIKTTIYEIIT